MPNLKNGIKDYIDWTLASFNLEEKIKWTNETKRFLEEDESHFVLYAVDTDIVKCYCAPAQTGTGSFEEGSIPYGVIFPPEKKDDQAASAITFVIAKYIFFILNNKYPIFQLPTQAAETKRVYEAVARDASLARDAFGNISDELKNISEKVIKNLENTISQEDDDSDILEIIDKLGELLTDSKADYLLEMKNYLQVLSDSTLTSTDDAAKIYRNDKDLSIVGEALVADDIEDWLYEYEYKEEWIDILFNEKRSINSYQAKKLEADAYALARLETINRKLAPLGGRMILITGANTIIRAAQEKENDFLKKYIRHFHSFLPGAFGYAENSNDAIDYILGFRALNSKKTETENNFAIKDLEKEWIEFRDKTIQSSLINSNELFSDILDTLRKKLASKTTKKEFAKELKKLSKDIKQEVLKLRISLVATFAKAGILMLKTGKRSPVRNPPNIQFDSLSNANSLFEHFLDSDLSKTDLSKALKDLEEDCDSKEIGINDLGYLYFLVTATIFASIDRWKAAEDMAGYAVMIAEEKPKTKSNSSISGREAYYLLAISKRLNAYSVDELKDTELLVDKALSALNEDKKKRPAIKINPYRFNVEKIALQIARYHFLVKQGKDIEVYNDIKKIYKQFEEVKKKTPDDFPTIVKYSINGLQAISLACMTKNLLPEDIKKNIEAFSTEINAFLEIEKSINNKRIQKTYLMKAYWLFGNIAKDLISENTRFDEEAIERLFRHLEPITHYDKSRFDKLKKLCIKMIAE